ncbi:MAG: transglycosylase SLT domain-containing protein [Synergistaceae bacterium]|nr:transglycosylase SLT domain-containing protein [Synergistaceae bacterium]
MRNMKNEVLCSKIVAAIILVLTLVGIARADDVWIDTLFRRYRASRNLTNIVLEAGQRYGVDSEVIAAIIVVESSAKSKAVSKGGDYGLMQVRWKVHKKDIQRKFPNIKTAEDLLKPYNNIMVGTGIFARYQSQKKTLREALIRYSGGNRVMANRVLKILNQNRKKGR